MSTSAEDIARSIVVKLEAAWNAADGAAFAESFAEDADFVAIRGDYHPTKAAIAQGHQAIFDTIYKGSTASYVLIAARALTDDVILAHSRSDLRAPTGPLAGEHSALATLVLVQDGDTWRIAGLHKTLVAPPRYCI